MLVNKNFAGKELATEFGLIKFDEEGKCKDLKADQEKKLADLPGFKVEEEPKAVEKEVAKEEEEAEKPAPKRATKKAPAKK